MTDIYDVQKRNAGSSSSATFFVSALYLFMSDTGFWSLFSLKAVAFILVGSPIIGVIIGVPTYLAQRGTGKILIKIFPYPPTSILITTVKITAIVIILAQVGATFYVAKYTYNRLIHKNAVVTATAPPLEIQCKEPIPIFTLGYKSQANEEQTTA